MRASADAWVSTSNVPVGTPRYCSATGSTAAGKDGAAGPAPAWRAGHQTRDGSGLGLAVARGGRGGAAAAGTGGGWGRGRGGGGGGGGGGGRRGRPRGRRSAADPWAAAVRAAARGPRPPGRAGSRTPQCPARSPPRRPARPRAAPPRRTPRQAHPPTEPVGLLAEPDTPSRPPFVAGRGLARDATRPERPQQGRSTSARVPDAATRRAGSHHMTPRQRRSARACGQAMTLGDPPALVPRDLCVTLPLGGAALRLRAVGSRGGAAHG